MSDLVNPRYQMRICSFLLFFLLFGFNPAWSQAQTVRGTVVDHHSLKPIGFATVEIKGESTGLATGLDATFSLEVPEGKKRTAKLLFKALGYRDTLVALQDLIRKKTGLVKMAPQPLFLKEVVVTPAIGELIKGLHQPIEQEGSMPSFIMKAGSQIAVYMDNEEEVDGIIKDASFYITGTGKYKAPFRVRVYECLADGSPGGDILYDGPMITADRKNDWVTIDLQEYRIPVPGNGYFIALEWVFTEEKYVYKYKYRTDKEERDYGVNLGKTVFSEQPLSWTGNYRRNWKQQTYQISPGMYVNALIKSTIKIGAL